MHVSDRFTTPLLQHLSGPDAAIISFPITDAAASRQYAHDLLTEYKPALLIAIERCGLTAADTYLNMRGRDISATTARVDELFIQHPHSIGIGDGGNEIGMGNLADRIPAVPTLPDQPALTRTTQLVIASVANWGAYGILTALSRFAVGGTQSGRVCRIAGHRPYVSVNTKKSVKLDDGVRLCHRRL
jgi:hypothetical protein